MKRLVRGFLKIASVWKSISEEESQRGEKGRSAFASSREFSSRVIAFNAWKIHQKQGLTWSEDELQEVKDPGVRIAVNVKDMNQCLSVFRI